jgi:hypothetical protein
VPLEKVLVGFAPSIATDIVNVPRVAERHDEDWGLVVREFLNILRQNIRHVVSDAGQDNPLDVTIPSRFFHLNR